MTRRVLLVDDDRAVRDALGQTLDLAGFAPIVVGSFIEAKDHIAPSFDGVVVSDIRMPGKDGFALLGHVQSVDVDLPVILLTGEGDIPMAVRGMSDGAFDFLEKPCAPKDLIAVIERAMRTRALVLENRQLKASMAAGDAAARLIYGVSARAEAMRDEVRAAARSGTDVLVSGPPGTGTAKVAEVIHLMSGAPGRPFQKRAAAALGPDTLPDAFEAARGGALFLDEVAALSPEAQLATLDLLEAGSGACLFAGTYRDLEAEAQAGRFNPDLYYRLDMIRVRVPGLSERKEDIPVLFRQYVANACEEAGLPVPEIPQDVIARMMAQDWPGNAQALMNAAIRFARGLGDPAESGEMGLVEQLAQVERSLLIDALRRNKGNASETARQLKLPRKTFYDKLARYELKPENFR